MMQCVAEGHDLVALANLYPQEVDELDSYMFQTVGHHAIDLYSKAMGLPLYRAAIKGGSKEQGRDYQPTEGDEVEDLYLLLKKIKDELQVGGVSVGAILSNYQRVRVENVCQRLGLTPLAYLWRRDQSELLLEMIQANVHAILIKVAALGLHSKHLGKTIAEIQPYMETMKTKYHLNVCGEGGEYETFTLDCPLFSKRIIIDSYDVVKHDDDDVSPVFYIHFGQMHLVDKDKGLEEKSFAERIEDVKMRRGRNLHKELKIRDLTPSHTSNLRKDLEIIHPAVDTQRSRLSPSCQCSNQGFIWVCGVRATCKAEYSTSSILLSTQVAMETLNEQLQSNGYSLEDAVLIHLYVRNMSDFATINSVYCKYFKLNPPARVCVQANLPEGTALQLDCIAHHTPTTGDEAEGDDVRRNPSHYRSTMHIQGLSHWAPANLGPYSQAVQIGSLVFCAGVIPLRPSDMSLIEGGINPECTLLLRSMARILAAMHPGMGLCDVVMATCYVTEPGLEGTAKRHWEGALKEEIRQLEESEKTEYPSIPCLMNYIVVPRLPKGSSVEWHVIAATDRQQSWQYSKTNSSDDGVTMVIETAWCERSGAMVIMASVDHEGSTKEVHLQKIVKRLCSSVAGALEVQGKGASDILSYKVFHSQTVIPQMALNAVLHSELQALHDRSIHYTSIPVSLLPPPTLLNACIWVQGIPSLNDDDL